MSTGAPAPLRITPVRGRESGWLAWLILAIAARQIRGRRPPNLLATLARQRQLFPAWLLFAGRLMPGGQLPRPDTELVILRVAHNSGNSYEWSHHARIGRHAGLAPAEIERIKTGPDDPGWSARQRLLLRAADEIHTDRQIQDTTWHGLEAELTEPELVELVMLIAHYGMLATVITTLGVQPDDAPDTEANQRQPSPLAGQRILITGAARGIGAACAKRFHERGARLALLGIEPDALKAVADECGGAPAIYCDVRDGAQVEAAVHEAVKELGGLDVVIANAGVAAQLPLIGGDPDVFNRTIDVNLRGVYNTLRATAPHVAHQRGYVLAISSLAAAVHAPLLGAYSASKAGVEALGDTLRIELAGSGARVGVAYFAELDTDMTSRGFGTEAAASLRFGRVMRVAPLKAGVNAIERGVIRRSRRVVAPAWVGPVLPARMVVQRLVDLVASRGLEPTLEIARREHAALTTELPDRDPTYSSSAL